MTHDYHEIVVPAVADDCGYLNIFVFYQWRELLNLKLALFRIIK